MHLYIELETQIKIENIQTNNQVWDLLTIFHLEKIYSEKEEQNGPDISNLKNKQW